MAAAKGNTTQAILNLIARDPIGVRDALGDTDVLKELGKIGVGVPLGIQIQALHAPHPDARKTTGAGMTLCGRDRATRFNPVTCKDCLNRQAKGLGPPKKK